MAKHYLKARHLMLDIETLDTRPSAAVLSAAAVAFEFGREGVEISAQRQWFLNLGQQLVYMKRTVSVDTVEWWSRQPAAAKEAVTPGSTIAVDVAMEHLADFIKTVDPDYVWAQGASFDFPILSSLAQGVGVELWPFWIERDCRTVLGLPEGGVDRERIAEEHGLQAHAAIDDCLIQIHAMAEALGAPAREPVTKAE